MRNRALHDALREFALEAAAFLTDAQRLGGELEFDVVEESPRRGPALYRYRPLTDRFIENRWPALRDLPSCRTAAHALGAGASAYLRLQGLRGEQAEPALQAMLERLYEDATSFGFPEERFERVYADVEHTLYRDTVHAAIVAPLYGFEMEQDRLELGDGLALVRGDAFADPPPEAVWGEHGGEPHVLCVLERDVAPDAPLDRGEATARFRRLVRGLRLFKAGGLSLPGIGWHRSGDGRWSAVELEGTGPARGEPWVLAAGEESELCDFLDAVAEPPHGGSLAWALARFEMGCSRALDSEALSDYLLALRALLDATTDAGRASLALRLAALCAEEGERRGVRTRFELALGLERFMMSAGRTEAGLGESFGAESPRTLVAELESHLRALLRDVMCGYLESDLRGLADDILLESSSETHDFAARDLRREPDTAELEAVAPEPPKPARQAARFRPHQPELDGVTESEDWAPLDEDADSYSAPV